MYMCILAAEPPSNSPFYYHLSSYIDENYTSVSGSISHLAQALRFARDSPGTTILHVDHTRKIGLEKVLLCRVSEV